jgi:hypothetical protein
VDNWQDTLESNWLLGYPSTPSITPPPPRTSHYYFDALSLFWRTIYLYVGIVLQPFFCQIILDKLGENRSSLFWRTIWVVDIDSNTFHCLFDPDELDLSSP